MGAAFSLPNGVLPSYGAGWERSESRSYLSNVVYSHEAPLTVVSLGLGASVASGERAVERIVGQLGGQVLVYPIPEHCDDINAAVAVRVDEIKAIVGHRPVVFIGHSAGTDFNARTAIGLKEAGVDVLAMWSDSPFVQRHPSFVATLSDALVGLVRDPNLITLVDQGRYYALHPFEGLRTAEFCSHRNPRPAFHRLANEFGVPHLMTRGDKDVLVDTKSFALEVASCGRSRGVVALRMSTGHQEFAYFGAIHQLVCQKFLTMCTDLAYGKTVTDERRKFDRLSAQICSAAETANLDITAFDRQRALRAFSDQALEVALELGVPAS